MNAATLLENGYRKYERKINGSDRLYQKRIEGIMPDGEPYFLTFYEYDFSKFSEFTGDTFQYTGSVQLRNNESCFDVAFHVHNETLEEVELFFAKSISFYKTLGF